jgi:hypothetical protein
MAMAVQQGKAAVNEPRPCLLGVAEAPAAIPAIKAIRINAGREKLVSGSANVARCGPKNNEFLWTDHVEPPETAR